MRKKSAHLHYHFFPKNVHFFSLGIKNNILDMFGEESAIHLWRNFGNFAAKLRTKNAESENTGRNEQS